MPSTLPTGRCTCALCRLKTLPVRGQAATAQALYTQVAQQNPDMPYIQARLCEVCYAQGKFREALRHLRHLLKQLPDPDQPSAEQSPCSSASCYAR